MYDLGFCNLEPLRSSVDRADRVINKASPKLEGTKV